MPAEPNRLAQVMSAVAKKMRAEFEASEVVKHAGTKGSWREKTVRDFLKAYVPGHIRIAHGGEIISASGEVSNECDLLLFDRSTPPFLGDEDGVVVPCECVYGVIEVKTYLSKKELVDACEKIRRAKLMPKTAYRPYGRPRYIVDGVELDYFPMVGTIFAFGGPSLKSTADNVRSWIEGKPPNEWPDSIWILGKGYLAWWNMATNLADMVPSSESTLMFVDAEPATDVILPFALNVNITFGQAAMAPLLMGEYLSAVPLSNGLPHIWTE